MKSEILGIAYDVFNDSVKAKIYRDLISIKSWCETRRIKLVVACPDPQINFVLDNLGVSRVDDPEMTKTWLVYETELKPEYVPEGEDVQEIVINMRQPTPLTKTVDVGEHMNPEAPREQGRDATMMHLIDRPNPNPYAPTSPSGIAILFGT